MVPAPLPPHHPLLLEGDGPRSRSPPAVRDSFLSKQGARQHTGALAPVQGGASVPVHAADSPSDQGSSPDADGGLRTRSSPLGGGWRAEGADARCRRARAATAGDAETAKSDITLVFPGKILYV